MPIFDLSMKDLRARHYGLLTAVFDLCASELDVPWADSPYYEPIPRFRNRVWPRVLAPFLGFRFDSTTYGALIAASKAVNDEYVLLAQVGRPPDTLRKGLTFALDESDWGEIVLSRPNITIHSWVLVGSSQSWGLYLSNDEFVLICGVPSFMEEFVRDAGGGEAIRRRFLRFGVESLGLAIPETDPALLDHVGWGEADE